jgi:hypothetical protein
MIGRVMATPAGTRSPADVVHRPCSASATALLLFFRQSKAGEHVGDPVVEDEPACRDLPQIGPETLHEGRQVRIV